MKRSFILKVLVVVVLLLILLLFVFLLLFPSDTDDITVTDRVRDSFPFGDRPIIGDDSITTDRDTSGSQDDFTPSDEEIVERERLFQITDFPVSGFAPLASESDTVIMRTEFGDDGSILENKETELNREYRVRYADSANSSITDAIIDFGVLDRVPVSSGLVPIVHQSYFTRDGNAVLFQRYNKDRKAIETIYTKLLSPETTEQVCKLEIPIKPVLGDVGDKIDDLLEFLNRDFRTQVADNTDNPRGENIVYDKYMDSAVKTFQELSGLEVDGVIGKKTQSAMQSLCVEQEKELAKQELSKLEYSHDTKSELLETEIVTIATHPDSPKYFYIKVVEEGVIGILLDDTNGEREHIFTSPLREWIAFWIDDATILLHTKASAFAHGYMFAFDLNSKIMTQLTEGGNGLTAIGFQNSVLYANGTSLQIYNRETKNSSPLGMISLPEKCVFQDAGYLICAVPDSIIRQQPDSWYRGKEIFSDSLWRIQIDGGEREQILDPYEYDQSFDMIDIAIDPLGKYLYFRDKDDEFLWGFVLEQ